MRELETFLLSNLQEILESQDETAIEIANQIDADLVELSENLIDEQIFRDRLAEYAAARNTFHFIYSRPAQPEPLKSSSNNQTLKYRKEILPRVTLHLTHEFK